MGENRGQIIETPDVEYVEKLAIDHVDWFLEIIKPLLVSEFQHGYKHGYKDSIKAHEST